MRMLRIGAALAAGAIFGVAIVVACGGGPKSAAAQSVITCDVPPVTCTVPPVTCSTGTAVRSSVAGTWSVAITGVTGTVCPNGALHLSGSDPLLVGAWSCPGGTTGAVTGELVAGRLRLNLATSNPSGGFLIVDANAAADGKSATGSATGYVNGAFGSYSVALAVQ